jgi:SAM-dependent methyltransferase
VPGGEVRPYRVRLPPGRDYDGATVGGGERWHDGSGYDSFVGRWSRRVAERFVAWLEVRYGADWVDIGCGTGVLTRAITEFADPRSVIGVDPSRRFLIAAKGATRDSRVTFVEGEGEELPIEDRSTDVVVSGLVLNFIHDLPAALREMRRISRPGALIAGYVWDYGGEMQMMRRFWDAAAALDPSAAELDEGVRFSIARPEGLKTAFERAGLDDVDVIPIEVATIFTSFEDYWSPFLSGVAPAPSYAMSLQPNARERLRDLLDRTLPRELDGSIDLIARAWAVRGTV